MNFYVRIHNIHFWKNKNVVKFDHVGSFLPFWGLIFESLNIGNLFEVFSISSFYVLLDGFILNPGNHKPGHNPDIVGNNAPKHLCLKIGPAFPVTPLEPETTFDVGYISFYTTSPFF